jgi:succinate dehydrogenase/fumarate reductase flavoprotein subunit
LHYNLDHPLKDDANWQHDTIIAYQPEECL